MGREELIGLAVALGASRANAEAAFPVPAAPAKPSAKTVVGFQTEIFPDGTGGEFHLLADGTRKKVRDVEALPGGGDAGGPGA